MEEERFIHDIPVLKNQALSVFAYDNRGAKRRMRNSFVKIAGGGKDGTVLWAATKQLLILLTLQTDIGDTESVFVQYMVCILTIDEDD